VDDLVAWIGGLFDDCAVRAPFGIGWNLDRAQPPLTATVTPADGPTGTIRLARDTVLQRINFAARLQAFLDVELDGPVPPCPTHRTGLVPIRLGHSVEWRCPSGDFQCRVGDYEEALWPPGLDEEQRVMGPMLARRFHRRQVAGIRSFGVKRRDDRWVARIQLGPDADEAVVRAVAAPIALEVERVAGISTIRLQRDATITEPAHRALSIVGAPMPLAALTGRLHRADPQTTYDCLVDDTPVQLQPEHQIGPPGGPVVLDARGSSFAEEGDSVCCVGGFGVDGPVQGQTPVFYAGEIRVYE
jgi:hypothetical protein